MMNPTSVYSLSNAQFIEANRRGEIEATQRAALERAAGWGAGCAGLVATLVVIPAILGGALYFIASADVRRETPLWVYGLIVAVFGIILLAAAVPQALAARRAAALRGGVAAGRVEAVEGEVRWDGRRYRATAGDRTLKPALASLGLAPGRYRFYVLAGTDTMISAEGVAGTDAADSGLSLLGALASVHKFPLDALEANRQGRLAGSQSARLLFQLLLRLAGIGLTLAIAAALWLFELKGAASTETLWLAVIAGILVVVLAWQSLWLGLDLAAGKVALAEGPVERRTSYSGSGAEQTVSRYYVIDKLRFSVSGRGYDVLIPGLTYRVYYAPRSRRLMAIEPV